MSSDLIKQTLEYGTYYYPAKKHYNYNSPMIYCDNCGKCNLTACIGYEKYDLCLLCVDYLSKQSETTTEESTTKNIKPSFISLNTFRVLVQRPEFNTKYNGFNKNMYSLD